VPGGTVAESVYLAPPLVISEAQVDRVLETVAASIRAVV
jgi:adenosylmethionine-8-amino-7-oxononanoate aminotransferase